MLNKIIAGVAVVALLLGGVAYFRPAQVKVLEVPQLGNTFTDVTHPVTFYDRTIVRNLTQFGDVKTITGVTTTVSAADLCETYGIFSWAPAAINASFTIDTAENLVKKDCFNRAGIQRGPFYLRNASGTDTTGIIFASSTGVTVFQTSSTGATFKSVSSTPVWFWIQVVTASGSDSVVHVKYDKQTIVSP